MKYILLSFLFAYSIAANGQATGGVYQVNRTTPVTLPIGVAGNRPLDAKSKYFDTVAIKWREFVSTAEVLAYFPTSLGVRTKGQTVLVNTGGTLSNGAITGGFNAEYWFRDSTTDLGLILKGAAGSNYWTASGNNIYNNNTANVGIGGVPSSLYKLDVTGTTRIYDGLIINSGTNNGGLSVNTNASNTFSVSGLTGNVSAPTLITVPSLRLTNNIRFQSLANANAFSYLSYNGNTTGAGRTFLIPDEANDTLATRTFVRNNGGGGSFPYTFEDSTASAFPIVVNSGVLKVKSNWNLKVVNPSAIVRNDSSLATQKFAKDYTDSVKTTIATSVNNINRAPSISGSVLTFPSSYTPNRIAVFHNGMRLVKNTHYTETNPAAGTVTLLFSPDYPATIFADY